MRDGKTAAQIAETTGLSIPGVRHHLGAAGLTVAPADRSARVSPKREQVQAMLADGKTAREIGDALGMTVAGVRHHLKALRQAA